MRATSILLTVLALVLAACGDRGTVPTTAKAGTGTPTIATVNYPLAYFAERIGGDAVDVVFPAPADEDPAFWDPDDDALELYQSADRILLNGATYAKWVPKVSLAGSKLVDTSAAAADAYIAIQEDTTHAHGPEGEHAHGGTAFTTWLDLKIAMLQADAVRDALIALRPEQEAAFKANAEVLRQDLESLDAAIRSAVASNAQRPVVVSHPVYQYFAKAYGLNTRAVHWEPDSMPEASAWDALRALRESFPAKWMLWEGEPIEAAVTRLTEEGMESQVFDPCGNRPEEGDFLSVMKQNVKNLKVMYGL